MNTIKTPVTQRSGLAAGQLEYYNHEGYLVLEAFLSDEDMKPAREAMMHKVDIIARDLLKNGKINNLLENEPFPTRLARLFGNLTDEDFLKFGRGWRDRFPGYFHLMSNPKILDVVESLSGSEIFSNPVYNVRPKVPKVSAGTVPWHQDKSYWPDASANPVITVWIPLVDSTPENGCLQLISQTHKKPVIQHSSEDADGKGFLTLPSEYVVERKKEIVSLPVKAGSAVLFNDRLVHGSTPNNSDHVRWSVDLRYQPTDQDPMPQHGIGFLARSQAHPERVATLEDWLEYRMEHGGESFQNGQF